LENCPNAQLIARLLRDKCGAAAIEYGLIVALIARAIVAGATTVGTQIPARSTSIGGTLQRAIAA
jgi:pilus assembly protein Flp/PilA